jgi:tetratricopeptide (TPR) repeat protein
MAGTWESWAVDNPPLLARYVKPSEHLDLGVDLVALRQERNYQAIARAIYDAFCQRRLRYDINPYNPNSRVQEIRQPKTILEDSHVGTCLDLALLFAGECLGRGLCAVVVSIHGHAFVAVVTTSGLDSRVGAGRFKFQNGVIKNAEDYLALVEDHGFTPIECTGFVKSSTTPEGQFEGISRNNDGFLTFEDAVQVGKRHLEKPDAFKFAIDVDYLHGIEPYKPFEAESPAIQEIQKGIRTLLEGFRTNPKDLRVNAPPAARNQLFGRDAALQITENALRNHETVLVYGMGGMGKTAVALETAKRLHNAKVFADGIVWISDIDHASTTAICDAIARSLGNEDLSKLNPDDPSQRQQKLEGTRQLLSSHNLALILDDLALPDVAHEFLEVCLPDGMGALLTSRRKDLNAQTEVKLDVLEREDAKKLFLERSKQPAPDNLLDLTVNNICAVLEDHPLALVIAAGRVRAEGMTAVRLLERLQDTKSRLSTVAPSDAHDKDRNVRVSIQVSFDDLTDEQKRIFLMLVGCFAETTGLEFLSGVCDLPQLECEDRLGELVKRSLVDCDNQRFGLHALVRDFGRDWLGERLQYVQNVIVTVAVGYAQRYSQITKEYLDCLDAEQVNLLESVKYASQQDGLQESVFNLAFAIFGYLDVRGYWNERIVVGQTAMCLAKRIDDLGALAAFMHNTAVALGNQGEIEEEKSLYKQSLNIAQKFGDQSGIAMSLHQLGNNALRQSDYNSARRYYEQSLKIAQELGDQSGIAMSLHQLGMIAQDQGDYVAAQDYYEQSLKISQKFGDQSEIAMSLHQLGNNAYSQGNYVIAQDYYEQSLEIGQKLGNQSGIAMSLHQLGMIAQDQGDYVAAQDYYEQSLKISQELGDQFGIADSLHQLGIIAYSQGDYVVAQDYYEQSLKIRRNIGNSLGIASSIAQLGRLAAVEERREDACGYYKEALKIFEKLKSPYAQIVQTWIKEIGCT